jgi:hypothetical protein
MIHIAQLDLKINMIYIDINDSHSILLGPEIDGEFEEGDSINLHRIDSGYFRSYNHDSTN